MANFHELQQVAGILAPKILGAVRSVNPDAVGVVVTIIVDDGERYTNEAGNECARADLIASGVGATQIGCDAAASILRDHGIEELVTAIVDQDGKIVAESERS